MLVCACFDGYLLLNVYSCLLMGIFATNLAVNDTFLEIVEAYCVYFYILLTASLVFLVSLRLI